jgi:hypothetical protein
MIGRNGQSNGQPNNRVKRIWPTGTMWRDVLESVIKKYSVHLRWFLLIACWADNTSGHGIES